MSVDSENKDGGCDCGSGCCGGGGKASRRSQIVRYIALFAFVIAATFLIIRGMTRNADCAPGACSGSAGKGCCPASR